MKPNLKRIEATLHQLPGLSTASYPQQDALVNRPYSFEISSTAPKRNPPVQVSDALQQTSGEDTLLLSNSEIQSFPTPPSVHKAPTLPKFNFILSSHCNIFNPTLEGKLLAETQTDVASYEAQLQKIIHQIQETYMEGPLVDGWLESYPCVPEPIAMRHESVHLANYEEVCSFGQENVTCESPRPGYRLCGLDAAGQKWSRPCPLEQLPSISIAISRYQKLRQLLESKHHLERRLQEM